MTTDKIEGTLTTQEMFMDDARKWGAAVAAKMRANAARFQHGKEHKRTYTARRYNKRTGQKEDTTVNEKVLKKSINSKIRTNRDGDFNRIAFDFPLHGIFRMYGVGSGQPGAGSHKKQAPKIRVKRSMSDWLNQPIEQEFDTLADIVANFYGDKVLTSVYGVNFKKSN